MVDKEYSERELEEILGGTNLGYDEAKKRTEEALAKFKDVEPQEVKKVTESEQLAEVSEKELQNYLGGIRIENEEYEIRR